MRLATFCLSQYSSWFTDLKRPFHEYHGVYSLNLSAKLAFYFLLFRLCLFWLGYSALRAHVELSSSLSRNLVVMYAVPKTLNPVCRRTETFTPLKRFSVCFQQRNSSRGSLKGCTSETPQETWQPLNTAWIVKGRPLSIYPRLLKDQVN